MIGVEYVVLLRTVGCDPCHRILQPLRTGLGHDNANLLIDLLFSGDIIAHR